MQVPAPDQARSILDWAHAQNPGPWLGHSHTAARAARTIAQRCGMDGQAAYSMGLLHDIGRFAGVRALHHVYAGRRLMLEMGYPDIARICLTHSFPLKHIDGYFGAIDVTPEELCEIQTALECAVYDDYDRLIQFCDAIAGADGVILMEKRVFDVMLRHGIAPRTHEKLKAVSGLQRHFEQMLGHSVYALFPESAALTMGI